MGKSTWASRATLVAALAAASLGWAGTSGAATRPATGPGPGTSSHCYVPKGKGPGYDASIGVGQAGDTVCITVGEKLLVLLKPPNLKAQPWQKIVVVPSGILVRAPLALMLPRGFTSANFKAVRPGTVVLSSVRYVCPPAAPGTVTCDAMQAWRATVVVKARA